MSAYQIWMEGFRITGDVGTARMLGVIQAESFAEACDKLCSPPEWQAQHGNYDKERRTVWGCRLFDNETDARRSYG